MMDKGLFGSMFDFNGDGKLDAVERAAEYMAFVDLTSSTEEAYSTEVRKANVSLSSVTDVGEHDDELDFEGTGYSLDDLELMDDEERAEVLMDAGLDVDDYDF